MLSSHVADFLTSCRAAGLSPKTITWYSDILHVWCAFVGQRDWRDPRVTREFLAELQARSERYSSHPRRRKVRGGLSPFTLRGYVRGIRRFFNWLVAEGELDANPAQRLPMPKKPQLLPKALLGVDFEQLLAATKTARDRAILRVLRETGMRAGELCQLKLGDVDLQTGIVSLVGKGNKQRYAFLLPATVAAVRAWLDARGRVSQEAPLFETLRGPMTIGAVENLLRRLARRARVTGHCNAHAFRHAFGRDYVLKGGDLASLADLLGHADIETTKLYSRFTVAELQELHRRHSPLAPRPGKE